LTLQPTTEELARHILKRVYEHTDGRPMEWRTLVTNKTGEAAVELAVDNGWLLVDGNKGVCLTDKGRAEVKKGLS
jgi:adenosyl cobinamide kinase/adenosyl cobinamide phosphate guanylyltransferase